MSTWERLDFNQPISSAHMLHREQLAATDILDTGEANTSCQDIVRVTEVRAERLTRALSRYHGGWGAGDETLRTISTNGRE